MEESPHILHEFIEVEVDADGALELLDLVLLEEEVVVRPRGDLGFTGLVGGCGQGLDSLDDQVSGEVGTDEADHLVVVQCGDDFIVRGGVENLLHLLQERLSIELSGRDEGVLPE